MSAWDQSTPGELTDRDGGFIRTGPFGSQLQQRDYTDEGVPVIMPKDISDGRVSIDGVARVAEETADRLSRHQLKPRAIVLPRRGDIGKRAFIKEDQEGWLCGTGCLQIGLQGKCLLPEFLYYFMEQSDTVRWLEQFAVGVTMLNLSAGIVAMLPVRYPGIPVQRRIAETLSAYDDLIENNRRRMKLLEDAARLLYQEWFVRLRFPGHERVRVIRGVPEGWERIHLADKVTTQYGHTETATEEEVGPKFLRGTDINKAPHIDWSAVPYCPIDDADKRKYQLHVGDIVIIRMADLGKVATVERGIDAVFASYLIRVMPSDSRLTPYYLFYSLSGDEYQGFISGVCEKSTRKTASAPLLVNFHLNLPPEPLARLFEEAVQPLRRQVTILLIQNEKLRAANGLNGFARKRNGSSRSTSPRRGRYSTSCWRSMPSSARPSSTCPTFSRCRRYRNTVR